MGEYRIERKERDYYLFDKWITNLEMRAFGWHNQGDATEWYDEYDIEINWETGKGSVRQRFRDYTTFARIKPYSFNVLFNILEFFMNIQSWIRRKLIILLWFIDVLLFGIGIFMFLGGSGMNEYISLGVAVFAFIYGPSLVYALLGFAVRKIFSIESKLEDSLERNGYERKQNL